MKYLIMIYHSQRLHERWEGLSEAEREKGMQAHLALIEDLVDSGEMVVSEALADPSMAKRVSVDKDRTSTIDGPFPEVKEYLAGFYLIECDSLERALERAAQIPEAAVGGTVEVRPVQTSTGLEM
ncbi:YciI family protein [Actinomadura fulvescens]|uniref:YciI family protein n=1 Tax=Actinomadura fulvescens TaxID=46160 RepID=A0ABN3PVB3_9ACTN